MLRWSLTYALVIMLMMTATAAGWMVFSTRQAVQEVEAIEKSFALLKRELAKARSKLRQAHSAERVSQTELQRSQANLKKEQTARGDAQSELAQVKAINKTLKSKLANAELALQSQVERTAGGVQQTVETTVSQPVVSPSTNDGPASTSQEPRSLTASTDLLGNLALAAKGVGTSTTNAQGPPKQTKTKQPTPVATSSVAETKPAVAITTPKKIKIENRTITSRLNVRATPAIGATLVVTLKPGQKVNVTRSGSPGGWHKLVGPAGLKGFIKSTALVANSS